MFLQKLNIMRKIKRTIQHMHKLLESSDNSVGGGDSDGEILGDREESNTRHV